MSPFLSTLIILLVVTAPILALAFWQEYKISKREDEPGDIIREAREEGPAKADKQAIRNKKEKLRETERNILQLSDRELLAYFGLASLTRIGVDEIRHEMGEPVVQVVIYESILKWYGIPIGFERTRVRHYDFEIEITYLDEIMGEDVVAVQDNHGFLKAMGISAYEEEEYEDCFGDKVRERVVRTWNEDADNRWGVEYQLERERVLIDNDPVWNVEEDSKDKDYV